MTAPEDDFIVSRNRDAWYVFRGFVYQVQHTILAILRLAPGEYLQLECGEDVDHILGSGPGDVRNPTVRVLDQIKNLTQSVTLQSSQAREAVLNAADHLLSNRDKPIQLRFRFTTSASPGHEVEAPPCFAGAQGIALWEATRLTPSGETLSCLHSFVSRWTRPAAVTQERWTQLFGVLSSDLVFFSEIVRRFEWSLQSTPFESMEGLVRDALVSAGLADSSDGARGVYERLLIFVLGILVRRGPKRVTREDAIESLQRDLTPGEKVWSDWLKSELPKSLEDLSTRVANLERTTALLKEEVAAAGVKLDHVAAQLESQGRDSRRIVAALVGPMTLPPLPPRYGIQREGVVDSLANRTKQVWLALHGSHGTGKTLIARELAVKLGRKTVWIRLRETSAGELAARVATVISGEGVVVGRDLLVLDDLPDLAVAAVASDYLLSIASTTQATEITILSTSNYTLPPRLRDQLGAQGLSEQRVPPMSAVEVGRLLAVYGSPVAGTDALVPTVLAFSDGHPQIVAQLCAYLRDKSWTLNEVVLEEVLGRRHLGGLEEDVTKDLLRTVPADGRTLLYRLRLAQGTFTLSTAQRIALVEPPVRLARERLVEMTGPWLQQEQPEEFSLSPLIGALSQQLPETEVRACHVAFASALLKEKGPLDQWRLASVLRHLISARKPSAAAKHLFRGLLSLLASKEMVPDAGLTATWSKVALPKGIPLALRIQLRAVQLAAGVRYGRDVTLLERDLPVLIAQASSADAWSIVSSAFLVVRYLFPPRPDIATLLFKEAMLRFEVTIFPDGRTAREFTTISLGAILQLMSGDVDGVAHATHWLDCLEAIPPSVDPGWLEVEEGAGLACARLFLHEYRLPVDQQNWEVVLQTFTRMSSVAAAKGLQHMVAAAEGILLSVRAEHLSRRTEGLELALQVVASLTKDGAKLIVWESIARQLALVQDWAGVRATLDSALAPLPKPAIASNVLTAARILAARAWLNVDRSRAAEHAKAAVAAARSEGYGALSLASVLGDAAIAVGRAGDEELCIEYCSEGLVALLEGWQENDQRYHTQFLGLSEVVRRVSKDLRARPKRPLTELDPGWFREIGEEVGTVTSDKRGATIMVLVSEAASRGQRDVVLRWANYAWETMLAANGLALRSLTFSVGPAVAEMDRDKFFREIGPRTAHCRTELGRDAEASAVTREEYSLVFLWSPMVWRLALDTARGADVTADIEKLADVLGKLPDAPTFPPYWAALRDGLIMFRKGDKLPGLAQSAMNAKYASLGGLLAMLASFGERVRLEEVVNYQMVALANNARMIQPTQVCDTVVLPLLIEHWKRRLKEQRLMFRAPRCLETELSLASDVPGLQRAAMILREAALSLGVPLFPWFVPLLPQGN